MFDDRRESFYDAHFGIFSERYKGFDELSSRVMLELVLSCDIATHITARYVSDFGLSKSAFSVLMLLRHGPSEGMQLHDIGELLLVSRANITGLIDHLEQKGFVTREVPSGDRRVRYARITPQAEELLDQVAPVHFANVQELLSDLKDSEKEALRTLLKKVRQSLMAHAQDCPRYKTPDDRLHLRQQTEEHHLRQAKI